MSVGLTVSALAADQKDSLAQYILGTVYYSGNIVRQDYIEALKWFQKLADQGNPDAQLKTGWMYEKGEGISQDSTKAIEGYKKSAGSK